MSQPQPIKYKATDLTPANDAILFPEDHCIYLLKQCWVSRSLLFCQGVNRMRRGVFNLDDLYTYSVLKKMSWKMKAR